MKILIASTNAPGHLNPLLAVANILRKHNHEVVVQAATVVRAMVEAAGLPFLPFLPEADLYVEHYLEQFPERQEKPPGLEMICFDFEHFLQVFSLNKPLAWRWFCVTFLPTSSWSIPLLRDAANAFGTSREAPRHRSSRSQRPEHRQRKECPCETGSSTKRARCRTRATRAPAA